MKIVASPCKLLLPESPAAQHAVPEGGNDLLQAALLDSLGDVVVQVASSVCALPQGVGEHEGLLVLRGSQQAQRVCVLLFSLSTEPCMAQAAEWMHADNLQGNSRLSYIYICSYIYTCPRTLLMSPLRPLHMQEGGLLKARSASRLRVAVSDSPWTLAQAGGDTQDSGTPQAEHTAECFGRRLHARGKVVKAAQTCVLVNRVDLVKKRGLRMVQLISSRCTTMSCWRPQGSS